MSENVYRNMVNRINLLLQAKNITARQFAEEIGIQPSGMSHILSGRNNPSLDFVMKVIRRWPEVNINWLMFGKGEMFVTQPVTQLSYATSVSEPRPAAPVSEPIREPIVSAVPQPQEVLVPEASLFEPNLFSQSEESPVKVVEEPVAAAPVEDVLTPQEPSAAQLNENRVEAPARPSVPVQPNLPHKKAVKIIVLYDDHTFSEYCPA